MSVFDYFIGTTQSKYASVAMILTILTMCIAILVTNTDVSLGMRFGVVLFVILISIFPVAISLFELTCIVTGGRNTKFNLCNYFAWFVTIMIIIYSFILIIMIISSMFTYKKAQDKITMTESMSKISSGDANKIAEKMMKEEFETNTTSAVSPAAMPSAPMPQPSASVSQSSASPSLPSVASTPQKKEQKEDDPSSKQIVAAGISSFANYMPF